MRQAMDGGDFFIIAFVAVIFIGGAIAVYKFMRGGKR
jgi:hypothetical protein